MKSGKAAGMSVEKGKWEPKQQGYQLKKGNRS
ncbi:Uncharacterised protein [Mycobacteroides abscessus subsp. abscessus]|nr:Uncharacterised protein [Mycobacteroides abscessus subsp. abscessus]